MATWRPPRAVLVVLRSNYDAHTKFELGQPIRSWLITFFTDDTLRHAMTVTFDLERLTWWALDGIKFSEIERGRVIAI